MPIFLLPWRRQSFHKGMALPFRGFSQETENGRKYYEAEMVVNGHSKDVLIDTNGA